MENTGIIKKFSNNDWCSPLVAVPKSDGGVRWCVDYKVGVNQRLVNAHYPIRKIELIFNGLRNAKYFYRLDLHKALLLMNHPVSFRPFLRMNRLSFGIKTAPAEFNRIIDQILWQVPNTEFYFYDIIIHGRSIEECKSNLKCCLRQLSTTYI